MERLKRLALRWARPVRCEACGAELFRTVPLAWRGAIRLPGAEYALVRADWGSMNELVFRHVEAEHCRRAA
jgi:hypothetical protein